MTPDVLAGGIVAAATLILMGGLWCAARDPHRRCVLGRRCQAVTGIRCPRGGAVVRQ